MKCPNCDFYPRPPRGGRQRRRGAVKEVCIFLSTPSARRATAAHTAAGTASHNFYPRPPRGGRPRRRVRPKAEHHFYPRPPRGGRPARGEKAGRKGAISIHALREEGDQQGGKKRRAEKYFYPRPPRGGRHFQPLFCSRLLQISIHALREEGDACVPRHQQRIFRFLSTPSARRATLKSSVLVRCNVEFLSTPSARRATVSGFACSRSSEFLSTPSARRATRLWKVLGWVVPFLSTPSARRATAKVCQPHTVLRISIHALREEGDNSFCRFTSSFRLFLSTPSARRATSGGLPGGVRHGNFYPRPPRGGRQQKQRQNLYFQTNCTTFCTNLEEP